MTCAASCACWDLLRATAGVIEVGDGHSDGGRHVPARVRARFGCAGQKLYLLAWRRAPGASFSPVEDEATAGRRVHPSVACVRVLQLMVPVHRV